MWLSLHEIHILQKKYRSTLVTSLSEHYMCIILTTTFSIPNHCAPHCPVLAKIPCNQHACPSSTDYTTTITLELVNTKPPYSHNLTTSSQQVLPQKPPTHILAWCNQSKKPVSSHNGKKEMRSVKLKFFLVSE